MATRAIEPKRTYPKHRVRVTFDSVTPASADDNGWIAPETEQRRSLKKGGRRMYERNLRMSRAGRFDWKLRAAIRFLEHHGCGSYEGESNDGYVHTQSGRPPYTEKCRLVFSLSVQAAGDGYDIVMGRNGYEYGERVSYTLHVDRVSHGTAARLRRVLQANGVRFYR